MFIGYLKTGGGRGSWDWVQANPLNLLWIYLIHTGYAAICIPWTNYKNKIASPISKNDVFDRKNTDIIIIESITLWTEQNRTEILFGLKHYKLIVTTIHNIQNIYMYMYVIHRYAIVNAVFGYQCVPGVGVVCGTWPTSALRWFVWGMQCFLYWLIIVLVNNKVFFHW